MNKKEILEKILELDLPTNEFVVLLDTSLVLQKVISKTDNISLSFSENTFNKLKEQLTYKGKFLDEIIYDYKGFLVFPCHYYSKSSLLIDNIYCQNLLDIRKLKSQSTLKIDKSDIKKIDLFLDLKDTLKYEKQLYEKGYKLIAGVDEVGRGPLVGPVVAGCVILPKNYKLEGLTDSKKLTEKKRNEFDEIIKKDAISYGIGVVSNEIIDEKNIYEATKLAMKEAIKNLKIKPDYVLTDAMNLDLDIPVKPLIKGDLRSLSISAASVIAKVYRDNLMYELDKKYPFYDFKNNKGYPTKSHINGIEKYGIIKEHRRSYSPVKEYVLKK